MKETIQEKRKRLHELSIKAKELQETGEMADLTINQIIVEHFYKSDQDREFKTFKTWIKDGFAVRKGEKAFLLWGRKKQEVQKPSGETETEELEFFPITYVFSNNQVDPLKND